MFKTHSSKIEKPKGLGGRTVFWPFASGVPGLWDQCASPKDPEMLVEKIADHREQVPKNIYSAVRKGPGESILMLLEESIWLGEMVTCPGR